MYNMFSEIWSACSDVTSLQTLVAHYVDDASSAEIDRWTRHSDSSIDKIRRDTVSYHVERMSLLSACLLKD